MPSLCPVFREFILSKDYYDRIDDDKIYMIKELHSIFNSMWNQGHSLNPKKISKYFSNQI